MYPQEDNQIPEAYLPYQEEPPYKAGEYRYFGNAYDDDYESFVSARKDKYRPEKVEQVDTWTDYKKFPEDADLRGKVTPINEHIVSVKDTEDKTSRYDFKMIDYIFLQEEYEHNLRLQSRLIVVVEAFKEASYFMQRKQDATEEIIMQNNHNIRVH